MSSPNGKVFDLPGPSVVSTASTATTESNAMEDEELLRPIYELRPLEREYAKELKRLPYEMIVYICEFVELTFNEELKKRLCEKHYLYEVKRNPSGNIERPQNVVPKGTTLIKFLFGYFSRDPNRNTFLIFKHIHDHYCGVNEIPLKSLTSLSLDVTNTTDINAVLKRYPSLEVFKLIYCNRQAKKDILKIEKTNHQFKNIFMPYFSSADMEETTKFAEWLASYPTMENVTLFNHKIGNEGAKLLAAMPNLKVANVDKNNISDAGAMALFRSTSLKILSIAHNTKITHHAFKILASPKEKISIQELNLTRIPLDEEVMNLLIQVPTLKHLVLGGVKNDIQKEDYNPSIEVQPKLLRILAGSKSIHKLTLRFNYALANDTEMLWLIQNPNLKILDTSCCQIEKLPEGLMENTTLEKWKLTENKLGNGSMRILAGMRGLKHLIIDDNKIDDAGAEALAQTRSIVNLSINGHAALKDAGVQALLACPSIEHISILASGMTDEGLRYLSKSNVKYLYCHNTDVGDHTITQQSLEYIRESPKLRDFRLYGKEFIMWKRDFDIIEYESQLAQEDGDEPMNDVA